MHAQRRKQLKAGLLEASGVCQEIIMCHGNIYAMVSHRSGKCDSEKRIRL